MEPGVYEIQGKDIYAQVFDAMTEDVADRRPESHEKYLDVQFLVSGRERLGFTKNTGNYKVAEHIKERDLIFYEAVEDEGYIESRRDVSVYSSHLISIAHRLSPAKL